MLEAEFPVPIDASVKFMDRYTLGDIARIGVPTVAGLTLASGLGVVAGAAVGLALAEVKPNGKTLDEHIAAHIGFGGAHRTVASPGIQKVLDDSVILENGTVLGIVKIHPCDFGDLSQQEKQANWNTVHDLLKKIDYRIELHSRQHDVDLSEYTGSNDFGTTTEHLAIVRVTPGDEPSIRDRLSVLNDRCKEIRQTVTAADLYAERPSGDAFKQALKPLYLGEIETAPDQFETDHGTHPVHRMRYIARYPERLDLAWLAELLSLDTLGLVNVIQVANPINEYQRARLSKKINRIAVELSYTQSPGREATLQQQKRDAEDMLEIAGRGEVLLNYGVYITVQAATAEEAERTLDAVESRLHEKQLETEEPVLRTDKAAKAASAFHPDELKETLVVPARSAAAGFPFAANGTFETGGIVVGTDQKNGSSVVLDRFSWEAGHMGIMGKTGSGKSYWAGLMLLRSQQAYDDLEIYILDPKKRDYQGIIDALGGQTVVIDDEIEASGNPDAVRYTVEDPTKDNTGRLVETVQHIYHEATQTDSKTLIVLDEAHRVITDVNQIHQDGLNAVSQLVREGRIQNIAVSLLTQNADEFTRSREGKNILRNLDCYAFFRQQDVETEVEKFFKLSEDEAVTLRKLQTGTQLPFSTALIRGPVNTKLRIESTTKEHRIIENTATDGGIQAVKQTPETSTSQGQPTAQSREYPAPTSNDDAADTSETLGLFSILNRLLNAPAGLFETSIVTGLLGGLALAATGLVEPTTIIPLLDPVGILPLDDGFPSLIAAAASFVLGLELVWIMVLTLYYRLKGVSQE